MNFEAIADVLREAASQCEEYAEIWGQVPRGISIENGRVIILRLPAPGSHDWRGVWGRS